MLQKFIAEMEETSYDTLLNVLLSEKIWKYKLEKKENEKFTSLRMDARRCLLNEKRIENELIINARGVAWAIFLDIIQFFGVSLIK